MDFDFDTDERRFIDEVRAFIQEQSLLPDAADVMAPDRDSDSMLSDTPARRRFNQEMAKRSPGSRVDYFEARLRLRDY